MLGCDFPECRIWLVYGMALRPIPARGCLTQTRSCWRGRGACRAHPMSRCSPALRRVLLAEAALLPRCPHSRRTRVEQAASWICDCPQYSMGSIHSKPPPHSVPTSEYTVSLVATPRGAWPSHTCCCCSVSCVLIKDSFWGKEHSFLQGWESKGLWIERTVQKYIQTTETFEKLFGEDLKYKTKRIPRKHPSFYHTPSTIWRIYHIYSYINLSIHPSMNWHIIGHVGGLGGTFKREKWVNSSGWTEILPSLFSQVWIPSILHPLYS